MDYNLKAVGHERITGTTLNRDWIRTCTEVAMRKYMLLLHIMTGLERVGP